MLQWYFIVHFKKPASFLVSHSSFEKKKTQDEWNNSLLCTSAGLKLSHWQETGALYHNLLLAYADLM